MLNKTSWLVYIVRCIDNTYYTGSTNNLERRLAKHNSGKGARYTSGRRPVKIVYSENCRDHSAALKREAEIKKLTRAQKETLIN